MSGLSILPVYHQAPGAANQTLLLTPAVAVIGAIGLQLHVTDPTATKERKDYADRNR
jgi:hypothetical protein